MIPRNQDSQRVFKIHRYTLAWAIGTGIRVSVAPGEYRVTGEDSLNGIRYIRLEERYRIDLMDVHEADVE